MAADATQIFPQYTVWCKSCGTQIEYNFSTGNYNHSTNACENSGHTYTAPTVTFSQAS